MSLSTLVPDAIVLIADELPSLPDYFALLRSCKAISMAPRRAEAARTSRMRAAVDFLATKGLKRRLDLASLPSRGHPDDREPEAVDLRLEADLDYVLNLRPLLEWLLRTPLRLTVRT